MVLYVIEKYRETIFGSILVVSENRIRIRKL